MPVGGSVNGIASSDFADTSTAICLVRRCIVAIGPSIGPCCYEIDEQVISPLKERVLFWREVICFSRPGHYF